MEGFLFKKGRGDSSFGRRNWKQRWFILDGRELSYYEDFDANTGAPIGFKGKTDVANCECYAVNHHDKKNTFIVQPKNDKEIHLQAADTKLMNLWMKEIATAARGEKAPTVIDYEEAYSLLGLNIDDAPSSSEVNRAYRKAALKCHPDKGGDLDDFEKIQKAFNNIMAKMEEEEFEREHMTIVYDVVLRKEPGDIGLGMVVIEDPAKRVIQVKEIIPGMKIENLAPEAKGSLKSGDILVNVAGVNVRGMPLSRVAQKLNQFRVPVGSTVKLSFERKVPRISLDPNIEVEIPLEEKAAETPLPSTTDRSNTKTEATTSEPKQQPTQPQHQLPNFQNHRYETKDDKKEEPLPYDAKDSILAENDELKSDLFAKMKALELQRQENQRLEKELERHKTFLRTQSMEQKVLQEQLKLSYLSAKMTKEQLADSMNQLLKISQQVSSGKELRATPEIQKVLQKENLGSDQIQGDQLKAAQRVAVTAALSVDVFGITASKWTNESELLSLKLANFEQKIQNLDFSVVLNSKNEHKVNTADEEPNIKLRSDSSASVSTLGLASAQKYSSLKPALTKKASK